MKKRKEKRDKKEQKKIKTILIQPGLLKRPYFEEDWDEGAPFPQFSTEEK